MAIRALVLGVAAAALATAAWGAEAWKAPRNAFGQPDLAGVWTNATITTLERPANFGERKVLTDAEAAAMEAATRRA